MALRRTLSATMVAACLAVAIIIVGLSLPGREARADNPLHSRWLRGSLIVYPPNLRGNAYCVSSATGSDTDTGLDWDHALATIDGAVNKCTANQGDLIYVAPNHAETLTAAGGITADIAGVTIIGLGNGEQRPTITLGTADTATVLVSGADVTIRNLLFVVGIDSLKIVVDVDADDCTIEDCEFREGSALQALTFIDVNGGGANAADRAAIRRCVFVQTADGGDRAVELGEVADRVVIEDCTIDGDWDDAGIHNPTGKTLTNLLVKNCIIANRATGQHAVELVSACTGFAIDNRLYGDTLGTVLDPGSLKCCGNLETDAVDQAGIATPGTAAGALPDDSIDAGTIASNAIAAAEIADNAIDAGALAADAITAAKIADNAISEEHVDADAATKTSHGITVSKATGAIAGAGTIDIFEVSGGLVLITSFVGEVTVQMGADQDTTLHHEAADIAALLACDSDAVGTLYGVTGLPGDAIIAGTATVQGMAQGIVCNAGTIEHVTAGNTFAGNVTWRITYVPLESGASIAASP